MSFKGVLVQGRRRLRQRNVGSAVGSGSSSACGWGESAIQRRPGSAVGVRRDSDERRLRWVLPRLKARAKAADCVGKHAWLRLNLLFRHVHYECHMDDE